MNDRSPIIAHPDQHTTGREKHIEKSNQRKLLLGRLYMLAGISLFFLFAVYHLRAGNILHGVVLTGFGALLAGCFPFVRKTGNIDLAIGIPVWMMVFFSVYMVYHGGDQMSGALWSYFVPLVSTYLLGLKRGVISVVIMLTCICFLFFGPWDAGSMAAYSLIYKFRFLGSLTLVCIMALTYEYSQQSTHRELMVLSERLDRAAHTDELTGLSNRRDMKEKLKYETARSDRNRKAFCLLIVDIDDFKRINDRYGHDTGDQVLKSIARTMRATLRAQDVIARWGGEEFLLLLPETDAVEGMNTARRLLEQIAGRAGSAGKDEPGVTASIGLVCCHPGDDTGKAISLADQALYQAKRGGKNRVETAVLPTDNPRQQPPSAPVVSP